MPTAAFLAHKARKAAASSPHDIERELRCMIAALEKELAAVRKQMDWQAQHIHNLEVRLVKAKK